tara:strand:+ start:1339 stop:2166 length:828 start_codon:yes stop_codon:yes gene_type:complete
MSNKQPIQNPSDLQCDNAWTFEFPNKGKYRMFMLDSEAMHDRLWLLSNDFNQMRENGIFTNAFNVALNNHHDELAEILIALSQVKGESFDMKFPPTGENMTMQGMISAMAQLIQYQYGFKEGIKTAKLNYKKADWSVEVFHPGTDCIFSVNISELIQSDGKKLPLKVWLDGEYPEVLGGLCALLSLSMAKRDLSRISVILKALIATAETHDKQFFHNQIDANKVKRSSMGAYISFLVLHRYTANLHLDMNGNVLPEHNIFALHGHNTANIKQFAR